MELKMVEDFEELKTQKNLFVEVLSPAPSRTYAGNNLYNRYSSSKITFDLDALIAFHEFFEKEFFIETSYRAIPSNLILLEAKRKELRNKEPPAPEENIVTDKKFASSCTTLLRDKFFNTLWDYFCNPESGLLEFLEEQKVDTLYMPIKTGTFRGVTSWYIGKFSIQEVMTYDKKDASDIIMKKKYDSLDELFKHVSETVACNCKSRLRRLDNEKLVLGLIENENSEHVTDAKRNTSHKQSTTNIFEGKKNTGLERASYYEGEHGRWVFPKRISLPALLKFPMTVAASFLFVVAEYVAYLLSHKLGLDPIFVAFIALLAIAPLFWSLVCIDTQPVISAPYIYLRAKPALNPQIRKSETVGKFGIKWIHLTYENFLADCPRCQDGSKLYIKWKNPFKRERLISKCESSPNDHVYSYDPAKPKEGFREDIQ